MATQLGSIDLNSFKTLRDDMAQYFWFNSDSPTPSYGNGVHITLTPQTTFASNPTGQNILMNTDGISIRNGILPMMVLDNDSLDFNAVDTINGTYTNIATFGTTGARIGESSGAHSVIDANGQRFYASDGTTQLANIGYGETQGENSIENAPYYLFGTEPSSSSFPAYNSSSNYVSGDCCTYNGKQYVCKEATTGTWDANKWSYYRGTKSVIEGANCVAAGFNSHAEGVSTKAIGFESHAEGFGSIAVGNYSHAEGYYTKALRSGSHASGQYTVAGGDIGSMVIGYYNDYYNRPNDIFQIGNGTGDNTRSNAFTIDWLGDVQMYLDSNGTSSSAATSGTDMDLFNAIYDLGWYSVVIV